MTIATPTAAPVGRTITVRRLVLSEIVVGTIVNLMMNLFFAWITFPRGMPVMLRGWPGLAIDLLPATVLPAIMMTFIVTAILHRRMRGGLSVADAPSLPLPRPLWLRALAIALLGLILVALPTLALLSLLWPVAGNWTQLVIFKLVFSAFHAAVLIPIVILAGLGDRRRFGRL